MIAFPVRLFFLALAALCCSIVAWPVTGQSLLPKDGNENSERALPTPDIASILERALDSGASVIVVDSAGSLLSPAPGDGEEASAQTEPAQSVSGEAAAPQDEPRGAGFLGRQEQVNAFRSALFQRLAELPVALNEVVFVLRASSPDGTILAFAKVLILSLLLFAIGMVAERQIYGKRIARHFIVPRIQADPHGYSEKMPFLVIRFIGGLIGTLFSMAVAYAIGFVIYGPIEDSAIQYTATLVNIGYFSARFVTGLWRMILSPYLTQYRIPRLTDHAARRLHLWLSTLVIFGVFTMLFGVWISELGLNHDVFVFFASLNSFVFMCLNILMILVNKRAITDAILNREPIYMAGWPVRVLARGWAPLAIFFAVFAWAELVYDLVLDLPPGIPLSAGAYVILTVVIVVYGVINFAIERSFARVRAVRAMNAALEQAEQQDPGVGGEVSDNAPEDGADTMAAQYGHIHTYEELARRIAGILAFVAGFWAFLNIWRPGMGMMQDSLPARTKDVVVIIFLGYIAFNVFRIWIDGKIREEQGEEQPTELGDEGGGSNASRLATLLPLFRNLVLIVIVVTVALIVLMEMGVNVGPLFAGAGIVGVAVGFGSQSLVRDIFSGAFFLFDDAFRKGEYIEIGDIRGTVEKISVRSFQLRHHLGKLHTIPFGEIQVLTNYSRDWVMMKLPLRVTYDTDVEKVRKLIKKLGQRLLEDPEIGPDFIQPLKSQGVIEMQDSAMIIRVKFMTKPGDQWVIRKRVFQEIRDLFESEGIKFAHREVTVRLADGASTESMSPQKKDAVLAAAEAALDPEDLHDGPGGPGGDDR